MPDPLPALVWDREYRPDRPRATRCLLGTQGSGTPGGDHADCCFGVDGPFRFWWFIRAGGAD